MTQTGPDQKFTSHFIKKWVRYGKNLKNSILKINERFKEPIPLYKREGGVISLVEALDMYYG